MRPLLALSAALLFTPLSAQPSADTFNTIAVTSTVVSTQVLSGVYTTANAALRVTTADDGLTLTPTGQAAFDVFASDQADPAFNARAESLLQGAFEGDVAALSAALPAHRREAGTEDFARMLAALTERHGAVASVTAFGTTREARDRSATLVRVAFAEGDELVKLVWRGSDLALITRGTLPTYSAQPVPGEPSFAVLNNDDSVRALATFDDDGVTVRSAAGIFTAARAR